MINQSLLKMAIWNLQKQAVVSPDMMQGGAPADPAMAGGAPPPMDPAMMGGAPPPPVDPSMGGGAPTDPGMAAGGPPPADPAMSGGVPSLGADPIIQQLVQQTVQATMEQVNQGGGGGGKSKGAGKIDPQMVVTELAYMRKLLTHLYKEMGLALPPDILDTPSQVAQATEKAQGTETPAKAAADISDRGIACEITGPGKSQPTANSALIAMCRARLAG